jgi:cytochrome c oxidase assembly factor CtaG
MPGMNLANALRPLTFARAFTSWSWHGAAAIVIAFLLAAYLVGVGRARRRGATWLRHHTAYWCVGIAVLVIATQGSVAVYGDALFSMHMAAHLMLIMIAPILLVLGHPLDLSIAAASESNAERLRSIYLGRCVSALTNPIVGLALYAGVIAGTHLTNFMNTMMVHPWLRGGEQLVYVAVGFVFFVPLVSTQPIRWQLPPPLRMGVYVVAMPVDTFTGVILSQTNRYPWPAMAAMHPVWAPSLVTDLHAGGAVMWVGGDAIMAVLFGFAAVAWARGAAAGDGSDLGGWLNSARINYQTDLNSGDAEGHSVTVATGDSDADLDAYNAYLERLQRQRLRQP